LSYNLKEVCKDIRCDIMTCIGHLGVGHIGGCLSVVEMLAVLYFEEMNIDPANPKMQGRDRFVCSKGHAGPAVYATLANRGYFDKKELLTLNQGGTNLPSHCDMNRTIGIDMTTGSLGQGVSVATGMAMGFKIAKKPNKVYAICGDGELQEGLCWEAFMSAAQYKLDNLTVIIDRNNLQIDGCVDDVMSLGDLQKKMEGFGFGVDTIDGHNFEEILPALDKEYSGKPHCIIANTVKGKGVSFMENQASWHGVAPNAEQLEAALKELGGK